MYLNLQNRVTPLENKPETGPEVIENLKAENEHFFDTKVAPLFLLQAIEQYNRQAIAFNIPHLPLNNQTMTTV